MTITTSHHTLPPFPDNLETAPLVSISFASLASGDGSASTAFFEAAKSLGFFYLDFTGSELGRTIITESEALLKVQKQFFDSPQEEKDEYGRDRLHPFFAYRVNQREEIDGKLVQNESYNIRKVISWVSANDSRATQS